MEMSLFRFNVYLVPKDSYFKFISLDELKTKFPELQKMAKQNTFKRGEDRDNEEALEKLQNKN